MLDHWLPYPPPMMFLEPLAGAVGAPDRASGPLLSAVAGTLLVLRAGVAPYFRGGSMLLAISPYAMYGSSEDMETQHTSM